MKLSMRFARFAQAGAAFAMLGCAAPAFGQGYPAKPISLVVPFPPGGAVDVVGRGIAGELSKKLPHGVVVLNQPGRDGIIGAGNVARAAPDGYTLLMGDAAPINFAMLMRDNLPYDPIKDFTPTTMFMVAPVIFAAHPGTNIKSIAELLAQARANPGKLRAGFGGSQLQIAVEMLKQRPSVDILSVPYKGGAPAVTDVLGGHIEIVASSVASIAPHARSGKLVALAVTSARRGTAMPDVPTMIELGFANFIAGTWFGVLGPKGMPDAVTNTLVQAVAEAGRSEAIAALAARLGGDIEILLKDDFARRIVQENERLGPAIRTAGMKATD